MFGATDHWEFLLPLTAIKKNKVFSEFPYSIFTPILTTYLLPSTPDRATPLLIPTHTYLDLLGTLLMPIDIQAIFYFFPILLQISKGNQQLSRIRAGIRPFTAAWMRLNHPQYLHFSEQYLFKSVQSKCVVPFIFQKCISCWSRIGSTCTAPPQRCKGASMQSTALTPQKHRGALTSLVPEPVRGRQRFY